ncbi:hypothetical protein [Streptomyces cyaneofuscatus]|uniref:hypothetical protein n=1 Tax=Streptomyces cyaneofuscatus TaxID=66883 RepID=UPI003F54C749
MVLEPAADPGRDRAAQPVPRSRRLGHLPRSCEGPPSPGVGFHKSCCGGPGCRPRTLREVRERMAYARRSGEPVARALVRYEVP